MHRRTFLGFSTSVSSLVWLSWPAAWAAAERPRVEVDLAVELPRRIFEPALGAGARARPRPRTVESLRVMQWRTLGDSVHVEVPGRGTLVLAGNRSFSQALGANDGTATIGAVQAVSMAAWTLDALWHRIRFTNAINDYAGLRRDFLALQTMDVLRSVTPASLVRLVVDVYNSDAVGGVTWSREAGSFRVWADRAARAEAASTFSVSAREAG